MIRLKKNVDGRIEVSSDKEILRYNLRSNLMSNIRMLIYALEEHELLGINIYYEVIEGIKRVLLAAPSPFLQHLNRDRLIKERHLHD